MENESLQLAGVARYRFGRRAKRMARCYPLSTGVERAGARKIRGSFTKAGTLVIALGFASRILAGEGIRRGEGGGVGKGEP